MNKSFFILLFLLGGAYFTGAQSMINQALVKAPEDVHILLIGLDHETNPSLAEREAEVLIRAIRLRRTQIAILVEYPAEFFQKRKEQAWIIDPFINKFLELWDSLPPEDKKKMHVIPADERSILGCGELMQIKEHLMRVASKLSEKRVHEQAEQAKLIKTELMRSIEQVSFPFDLKVGEFFDDLEKKMGVIIVFKEKYDDQKVTDPYIKRYTEAVTCLKNIVGAFRSFDLLFSAFIKGCLLCKTLAEFNEKIKLLDPCRFNTFDLMCDFTFLVHLMRQTSDYKNFVLLMGGSHVQRIVSILKSLNSELINLLPASEFETTTCDASRGSLGLLAFMVQNIGRLPEQQSVPSQLSCASSPSSKMAQSTAISIEKCHTCGLTENLKRCSRCQKVVYCSLACQRKDWNTHKEKCHAT